MNMKTPVNHAKWGRCLLPVAASVVVSALIHMPAQAQVRSCESLAGLTLPNNTVITTAQSLPGGNLTLTALGRTFNLTGLPPFCRVNGLTKLGFVTEPTSTPAAR